VAPVRRAARGRGPLQLAFILINLAGITDLAHADRGADAAAIADLLWFPTGGGKTEAYLSLTAYTLAIRRLQGPVGGRDGEHAVAALMHYTLRLLTLQQTHRASTLISACEHIRRDAQAASDQHWGETPFRIGLWVGGSAPRRTRPRRPTNTSRRSADRAAGRDRRAGMGDGPAGRAS